MKILVTGTDGYLGSLLAPMLLDQGHEVTGVDTGYYRSGWLYESGVDHVKTITRDIRSLEFRDLAGHDAVVHMAELSNDPAGELAPGITHEINHRGSVRLAELAKRAGIRRFIYMSSCSVYGAVDGDKEVDESTPSNPQTAYAHCKSLCEKDLIAMAGHEFSPVCFRNATAFGASPRQRFDLVVNNLCGHAWTSGMIRMSSDGTPWRPLVHANDIGRAILCALEAPVEAIHGEIINIGSNDLNHRVSEIAGAVAQSFDGCGIKFGESSSDNRSYRVVFDKLEKHLPEFSCQWSLADGIRQFHDLFRKLDLKREEFENRAFTRLRQLRFLIRTGQIDERFYWSPMASA
ncbi:MAG: NAD-dependent epimerase/dehydratase family protein [Luteolibacter sp.]